MQIYRGELVTGRAPAVFLGHGSPMNALAQNRYTETWRDFGAHIARPRAVLCVSAHWFINATAITAMARPRTIHDFYGFPPELFAMEYPAPGSPEIARQIAAALGGIGLDEDSWGLDHGAWSVLVHVFPNADVPVLQLSINALESFSYHLEMGRRLAALRDQNVLVLGSGNVVHNLRRIDGRQPDAGLDWARRFDEAAKAIMTSDPARIVELEQHPDFSLAVPTAEHFLPLLYLAGMAAEEKSPAQILIEGYAMGSLSMTACTLGYSGGAAHEGIKAAAVMGGSLPADQSNM